jgi:hypothetical protein
MRFPILALILAAGLLSGPAAHALEIEGYDRLDPRDQARFIDGLIKGAMDILTRSGHKDQAAKVQQIFTSKAQLSAALAYERDADARRAVEMPDASRLEVEDAFLDRLKKEGITLPDSFFIVNRDFRARLPVRPLN